MMLPLILLCIARAFRQDVHDGNAEQESRSLLRRAIIPAECSQWNFIYASRCERAFMIFTRLTPEAFDRVLERFTLSYDSTTMRNLNDGEWFHDLERPPRRDLPAHAGLALALRWCCSTANIQELCVFFGIIPSTFSRFLPYCLSLLLATLQCDTAARVEWPTVDEQYIMADMVALKYERLAGCFGTLDGLRLPLEESSDEIQQNNYYNGWIKKHNIVNVFIWGADGTIIGYGINFPGTYHDSHVCADAGLYNAIRDKQDPALYLAGDAAFVDPNGGFETIVGGPKIRRVAKANERGPQNLEEARWERDLTSYRQASEWGNQYLCSQFPRLKCKWKANDAPFRRLAITTILHLANFRTRVIGRNQLDTVFAKPYWQQAHAGR